MTTSSSNLTNGFGATHNTTEKENENRKLTKHPRNCCSGPRYSGYANCPPFMCSLSNFHHLTPEQERCGRINKAGDDNTRIKVLSIPKYLGYSGSIFEEVVDRKFYVGDGGGEYLRDSDSNIIAILPRPSFYINALRLSASAHDQNLLSLQYPKTSRTKSIETHTRNLTQALDNKLSKAVSEGARDPNELWQCTNFSHYRVKVSNIIYRSYFDITSTIIVACDYYTQVSPNQSHLHIESGLVLVAGVREGVRGVTK
ncbi:hypothetical protein BGZ57DRAFT_980738 [Hyaloscypha finlandica]|nr:hypothetical protein BGZ57DRAFT_980738 [Hyaloscypha finlandica]